MYRYGFVFIAMAALAVDLNAQPNLPTLPQPRLQSVFPCGVKAGATVEVTFAGTDLDEPEALHFSHPGLKAEPVMPPPPPPPDPKKPAPKPPMGTPAKPVITKFKVTAAPGTPLGLHDVRIVNKWGVSNPRAFAVGDRNEVDEKEPNSDVNQAQKIEINTVINGVINNPPDVDFFSFAGKKGQRVLMYVATSSIDSRAKPEIELYAPNSSRLGFHRNYKGADALLDATLPYDGEYLIRLYGFTHVAGSNDHFYRLTVTTGPWIDAIVPPMLEPGKATAVTIYGRNLPGGQPDPTAIDEGHVLDKLSVTITAPTDPLAQQRLASSDLITPAMSAIDGFEYRLQGPNGSSNPYLLHFARGPVTVEKEGNDKADAAQVIATPGEIAGRLDKRDDRDWYLINAKKGDIFTIELFGERLGTPADFYLKVKTGDPKAGMLAELEDNQENLHPFQFFSRHSDPQPFRLEAKEDGKYLILVGAHDASTEFGPRHVYRLRVTPEKPDFRLIVMPDSRMRPEAGLLRAGGETSFDVFIWRHDGFAGPIDLTVEGLPAGVTCPPQRIAGNQKQAVLVFSAAANSAATVSAFAVKGSAAIGGQTVIREARPATISWAVQQPQIPTLSRVDRQCVLAVRDKPPYRVVPKVSALTVKQGDKGTVNFQVTRLWPDFKQPIQVILTPGAQQNQPLIPSVLMPPITVAADKTEGVATINIGSNVAPGVYNLVLRGTAQFQFEKMPKGPKVNSGLDYPATPITLTIVPSSLGTISATAGNIKAGAAGEVTVKVSRANGYTGEYKLKLVAPAGTKISAPDAVIPAGKDEVKIKVQVAADVKPGAIQNVVVQSTAMFDGKTPITAETKFNLNVVK